MSDASKPQTQAPVPVVVLYRGGQGALAVARSLGRLGVPAYLVTKKDDSPAVQASRFWTKRFWWDFSAPESESLAFLDRVGAEVGSRPLLVTLADWTAIFMERNADRLLERFVFPVARTPVVRNLSDKWTMFSMARANGIATPETMCPKSRNDVTRFLETAHFPIVVKGANAFAPNLPSKAIVYHAQELYEKYDRETRYGAPNMIFQEFIPGGPENVWMCNAYFNRDSECTFIGSGRKLRQVSDTGIASLAAVVPNPEVEEATRRFMQGVGYFGPVGIGYRFDRRDGKYKVLDVNPRVTGVFRLFAATNGMESVRAAYLDLTGQPVPRSEQSPGRKWLLEDDVFAALHATRQKRLSVKKWLASLAGVRELHWFAGDDLLPGAIWLWNSVWPHVTSVVRRFRFAATSHSSKAWPTLRARS